LNTTAQDKGHNAEGKVESFDSSRIVEAASQLLSRAWNAPVRLDDVVRLTDDGRRNLVLRCRTGGDGTPPTVIIKAVVAEKFDSDDAENWDVQRFFSDWKGAAFLTALPSGIRVSPRVYAGDRSMGFFVLEDLGLHRSLVTPLLEEDASSATGALRSFGAALGRLHAATIGESARFEQLSSSIQPHAPAIHYYSGSLVEEAKRLEHICERLGVPVDPKLRTEYEAFGSAILRPGPLSPTSTPTPCRPATAATRLRPRPLPGAARLASRR
jgi:hypothetical protein